MFPEGRAVPAWAGFFMGSLRTDGLLPGAGCFGLIIGRVIGGPGFESEF